MEAIFLVCGAGGPQLKRNPLGGNPMKYVARVDKVLRPGIHKAAEVRDGKLTPGSELPVPDRVEIELLRPDSSCTMYRYTDRGEFCGDTWHETLADAFTQAAFEYGLSPQDFVSLPEG